MNSVKELVATRETDAFLIVAFSCPWNCLKS